MMDNSEPGSSNPNSFSPRVPFIEPMIGPLAAGKKAAEFGYKRYGMPGAVVAGTGAAVGTALGVKKLTSAVTENDDTPSE